MLLQAEVWNVDAVSKSEYTDVQLLADDVRAGRRVIAEHTKVAVCCHSSLTLELLPRYKSQLCPKSPCLSQAKFTKNCKIFQKFVLSLS